MSTVGQGSESRGRGRGFLRGKDTTKPKELRRPGSNTQAKAEALIITDPESSTDINDHSSSPPTSESPPNTETPHTPTAQEPVKTDKLQFKLSPFVDEFVPKQKMNSQKPENLTTPLDLVELRGPDNELLEYVIDCIFKLTGSPGLYDEMVKSLTDELNTSTTSSDTFIQAIDFIVRQAIDEPNFRYTGARMCEYLSENITFPIENGNFRQHLLKRCHIEHKKRDEFASNITNSDRILGFSMFLGELYMHMKIVGKDGNLELMGVLGTALMDILTTLLNFPTDKNMKCLVNILKFTGAVLEDNVNNQDSMNTIIEKIKNTGAEADVTKETRKMLMNVIELRATNWGRAVSSPVVKSQKSPILDNAQPFIQTEPIFYNTSGQQITREEAGYGDLDLDLDTLNGTNNIEATPEIAHNYDYELNQDVISTNENTPWTTNEYDDQFIMPEYELDPEEQEAFEKYMLESGL